MQEAAAVFGDRHGVKVEVVAGPTDRWLDRAKTDADVIFSSAEFMMSHLVHAGELEIDRASVTPLYLRPSAILVRPGNPRKIRDFPDLLRAGVRVMVVTGSGQTGLWEDMAGKQGDVRTIRAFRQNIVCFAPNSENAMQMWRGREDIDAWVTWNIWYLPLHDHADLVQVSDKYRVYRQCNAALTKRGSAKPLASRLIEFLISDEGAEIFQSWEWLVPAATQGQLAVRSDITVVCRVDKDDEENGVSSGLKRIRELVEHYAEIGVPASELHICAIVHGSASYFMLKDETYATFVGTAGENPNKALIRELDKLGVSVELCAQAMRGHGWQKDDVLPEVKIIVGASPRIIDLQLQGYVYWRF
jgi:accessory colonization factor AcfC